MIDFKKVRHAARPSKDLRTPSLFGSSNGPTKHRTTGPRNDLTGILVCRRSTGFTDTFGCHRHLRVSPTSSDVNRQSSHARAPWGSPLCKLCLENSGSPYRAKDTATEPLRKLTERLQDAHECLRALTGTSGFHRTPPGVHRTPPGVHRRSIPSRTGLSRPTARPAAARTTSVVHRTTSVDQQVRHARHERPRMLTGTSGFQPSPFGRLTEASSSTLAV